MKNLVIVFGAASLLFSVACKKSSSGSATANGWKLGTVSYTTKYCAGSASSKQLVALDGMPSGSNPAVNSCIITFSALPGSSGSYKIVSGFSIAGLAANEVTVSGSTYSPGATYLSTGYEGASATITVTGGKIKAVIPAITVRNAAGTDSTTLSGTIVEQ